MAAAGLTVVPSFAAASGETNKTKIVYRIHPLPGKKYNPSFLKFCGRMKFDSVAEAIRRVKDRSLGYLLVTEQS